MTIQEDNERKYIEAWEQWHGATKRLICFGCKIGDLRKELVKLTGGK